MIADHIVEAAALDSWQHFHRGEPTKLWELTHTTIQDAHRKLVRAMLETGADPEAATRRATGGKCGLSDVPDDGAWQKKLAAWLKTWARARGM